MNEDLRQLLILLRDSQLGWLADEIETVLHEFRESQAAETQEPEPHEELFRGESHSTDDEELALAIGIIHAHLVQPCRTWNEASNLVKGAIGASLQLSGQPVDSSVGLNQPFDVGTLAAADKLEQLLRQLWPSSAGNFHDRVIGGASS